MKAADRKAWCRSDNVVLAPGPLPHAQQNKATPSPRSQALPRKKPEAA